MNDTVDLASDDPDEHLDRFGQRAGKLLCDAPLDAALIKSLDQARATALTAPRTRSRYMLPIALWAACPMLATSSHNDPIVEAMSAHQNTADGDTDFMLEDFELIAAADDFELLEDLKFLQWLDAIEDAS